MPAVLVTGPTATQNSPFLPLAGVTKTIASILNVPTHRGMTRLSWPGWFGHQSSTNRTRRNLTLLMWSMAVKATPNQQTKSECTAVLIIKLSFLIVRFACRARRHHTSSARYRDGTPPGNLVYDVCFGAAQQQQGSVDCCQWVRLACTSALSCPETVASNWCLAVANHH